MGQHEVLVKWVNQPMEEATWEEVQLLHQKFPHFNIEANVGFQEGANVTIQPTTTGPTQHEEDSPTEEPRARPKRQIMLPKKLQD